jgi:hypothetical protein
LRKLAEKHNVKEAAIMTRAAREAWNEQRKQAESKAKAKTTAKIADKIAAQNLSDAQIAIKARSLLLQKCLAEAEAAAQAIGTESRQSATVKTRNGDSTTIKDLTQTRKLRDIAETIKTLMDITTLAAMTESDDSFEKAMTAATSEVWTDGDDVPI